MGGKLIAVMRLCVVTFAALLISRTHTVQAGARGTYRELYFQGTDAKTCGGWSVAYTTDDDSKWPAFTRPGNVKFTITDGTRKVIMEGTQNIFNGQPANVSQLRYPAYGMPDGTWTGATNPIHVVVT